MDNFIGGDHCALRFMLLLFPLIASDRHDGCEWQLWKGWRAALRIFCIPHSGGLAGTELEEGYVGSLSVGLAGSITGGGDGFGEVVSRDGGAPEGGSEGGIKGVARSLG